MVIVFDLGKVILDFDHRVITSRFARISGVLEVRVHDLVFGRDLERMYDRGKVSSTGFYNAVLKSLGIEMPFEEFRDIWTGIFTANIEVCRIIEKLKKRYRLILLSNTNEMHFDYALRTFEILSAFDDYVLSYRVGERKPHPKIYAVALERAGCPASECVYVDDMEEYVGAARRLGIHALVFRDAQQLEEDLRALNVDV